MTVVDNYTNVDCGLLPRAPRSQESLERLPTKTFQEKINPKSMLRALPTSTGQHKRPRRGTPKLLGGSESKARTLETHCRLNTPRQTADRTRCPWN